MTTLTIQDVSRRSGLSEPTLRYYEEVGLIGPIERDPSSRHRRYREKDLDTLQALACLRAMRVGIEDMRTYQANRARGHEAAGHGQTWAPQYSMTRAEENRPTKPASRASSGPLGRGPSALTRSGKA